VLSHCNQHGVDVVATKGYSSCSQLKDLAETLAPLIDEGQTIVALVLADFDPSGSDWPRAAEVEVKEHLERLDSDPLRIMFDRILMTQAQAASLGEAVALRPPNKDDSRTKRFLAFYGFAPTDEVCVELDALAPTEVRSMLSAQFSLLFHGDLSAELAAQDEDRQRIREALESLAA